MSSRTRLKMSRGFTLVELLVVIAIIGFLAAVIAPKLFQAIGKGQRGAAQAGIKNIELALGMYFADHYSYPDSLSPLVPKYLPKVPKDPWGNPYFYSSVSQHSQEVDIASYGKDGVAGGTGDNADIMNWDIEGGSGE
ncbi:MAG: type II secretion system major pseudopilin GspG [Candidatus Euphemobacter frigidus]|nr:type II secretion system major pseudopilin GspG [Candidatus Euphemobacter frigidus]MDP8276709.1 type II secretion system major pseudopilin GspG [Candidatus Euphemobacter frigidus]